MADPILEFDKEAPVLAEQAAATGAAFNTGQWNNMVTKAIPRGRWRLRVDAAQAYVALLTGWGCALSTISGNTTTDHVAGKNVKSGGLGVTGLFPGQLPSPIEVTVELTAPTTYYVKIYPVGATGDIFTGYLAAEPL